MKHVIPGWQIMLFIGCAIAVAIASSVWLIENHHHDDHNHHHYLSKEEWYQHVIEEKMFEQEMRRELKEINRILTEQRPY